MTLIKNIPGTTGGRRFDFATDTFAFANELLWEYKSGPVPGKLIFRKHEPAPDYAHRCFVLVRSARQFLYHARFAPELGLADDGAYLRLIRQVVSRNPRKPCTAADQVVIPGFASLREFSAGREKLLKVGCGGAWQSYVLRSHWRMVFPISRLHQAQTAASLTAAVRKNASPIIHLVTFPALTINHGMILFDVRETPKGRQFSCYDPNQPQAPAQLEFDRNSRMFFLPPNSYWAGGKLNVIPIYQSWLM